MKKLLSNFDAQTLNTLQLAKVKGGNDQKTNDIIIEDFVDG